MPILRKGLMRKSIINKPVPVPGIANPPKDTGVAHFRNVFLGGQQFGCLQGVRTKVLATKTKGL